MDLLITVLLLLVCLLISNVVSHWLPSIPTALTQILFGIAIAFLARDVSFEIETEWFFLLFIAPLLYNDGRHYPREALWKMKAPIFGNAIILVILTTLCGGFLINHLIPKFPLAAAFALAAILSPTDPVAVNGITKRIHIPEKVMNLVRGESLINDASGLIAFKYAAAAVVTGYFSLASAALDFAYVFIIGAISGVLLGLIVVFIRYSLRKRGITDAIFYTLLSLLTPFIIFIITEKILGASGVIAVVVAGFIHALLAEQSEAVAAEEKVLTENSWSIVTFILNGIVFILLGLNIPSSMAQTVADPNIGNLLAVGYVIAIGFAILAIRIVWAYISSQYQYLRYKKDGVAKASMKISLLTGLVGVRGAVTMAGILSIPYLTNSGVDFPNRSLMLFLASGVILFSLLMATILLPRFGEATQKEIECSRDKDLVDAKRKLLLAAIKGFRLEMNKQNQRVAYELIAEYKMMFRRIYEEQNMKEKNEYLRRMNEVRLLGLKAERKYIQYLFKKEQISQPYYMASEKALDYREESLLNNARADMNFILGKVLRNLKYPALLYDKNNKPDQGKMSLTKYVEMKALHSAIDAIREYEKEKGPEYANVAQVVIFDYEKMIERLKTKKSKYNERKEELKEELRIKIIDLERSEIDRLYESGEISRDQVRELRRFVNYTETIALYEYD